MFRELKNVIYDKTFKVIILKNKVNIVNYTDILIFEDETILVKSLDNIVKVKGSNLVINRLYNKELLIEGKIKTVEFGWYFDKLFLDRDKGEKFKIYFK